MAFVLVLRYFVMTFLPNLYFSLLLSVGGFVIPFFTEEITGWNVRLGLRFVFVAFPILLCSLGQVVGNWYVFRTGRPLLVLFHNRHFRRSTLVLASALLTLPPAALVFVVAATIPIPGA